MNKFERVLSDDDADSIIKNTTMLLGQSISRSKDLILKVEQAVLAKLAEQEPVAYLYADEVYGSGDSDINDYIRANGDPLYAHPMPCVSPTSDKTACVSESVESGMQELLPLPKPNCRSPSGIGYFDSFTKDQMIDYAKSAIEHYKAANNHAVGNNKMVTPLAQRKIQTLLDKGEYRVIENATVLVNENGHAAIVNRGGAFYWVDNEALAREFDAAWAEKTGE